MMGKVLKCLLFAVSFVTLVQSEEYYDKRYDYFDVDYFVNNPRLLKKYLDCFLDQGPCTPIGNVFKKKLPEVITTACSKCSPLQKRFTKKGLDAFNDQLPKSYAALRRKYDPKHKYFDSFEKSIADA